MKMRARRKLIKKPRYFIITFHPPEPVGEFNSVWHTVFGAGPVTVRFPKI